MTRAEASAAQIVVNSIETQPSDDALAEALILLADRSFLELGAGLSSRSMLRRWYENF